MTYACPQCSSPLVGLPKLPCPPDSGFDGVFECRQCGLCSLMPAPTTEFLHEFYAETGNGELRTEEQNRRQSSRRAALVERYVDVGSVYEVGASRGEFLAFMRDRGWKVAGLEPARGDVAAAKDRYGLELEHAFFDGTHTGDGSWDVLAAWDVLEHCQKPDEVLAAMKTWVRPGGLIIIAVPNIEGWGVKLFGEKWRYRMSPIHIHFYSDRWWEQQCERLDLEHVTTVGYAKVQAWAQGVLPDSARSFLLRQMLSGSPAEANNGAAEVAAGSAERRPHLLGRSKAAARRAVFELNQRPAPLPVADLIEVVLRVR